MIKNIRTKTERYLLKKAGTSDNPMKWYNRLRKVRNGYEKSKIYLKNILKKTGIEKSGEVLNVYHGGVQKTASQWIRRIFDSQNIKRQTKLETYPQHQYEYGEFEKKFPVNTFVPGLYISYLQYRNIYKPEHYGTFYVVRDPRDIVISWFRSMKNTHRLSNRQVKIHREALRSMKKEEGINYCIRRLSVKISFMRTWYYGSRDDKRVKLVRFENLVENPKQVFKDIFDHCNLSVDERILKKVLKRKNKKKMRKIDKKRRPRDVSNYEKRETNWKKEFTKNNLREFRMVNGNIIKLLGYNDC